VLLLLFSCANPKPGPIPDSMVGGWIDANGEFIRLDTQHSVYNALIYKVTLQDEVLQLVNIGNSFYTLNYRVILHSTDSLWLKPLDEKTQNSYTGFIYFNIGNGADAAKSTTVQKTPDTLKFFSTRLFVRKDFRFEKLTASLNMAFLESGNDVFNLEIDSAKDLYLYSSYKEDSLQTGEAFYLKLEDKDYIKLIYELQLTGFKNHRIIPGADFRFKIQHNSAESYLYFNLANYNYCNDNFWRHICNLNNAARAEKTIVKKAIQPIPSDSSTM
jgi:hypothetical protein